MKIEKISENQIRCTLTREDLATRKINIRELAYGSDKAKLLFQDMMKQAFREYGFSAENSPLMIEAIPLSGESIVLIITRVDNPEELDSRFARFSKEEDGGSDYSDSLSSLDDIVNLISKIASGGRAQAPKKNADLDIVPLTPDGKTQSDGSASAGQDTKPGNNTGASKDSGADEAADAEGKAGFDVTRFFLFQDLDTVIRSSRLVGDEYQSWNTLFKNPEDGNYFLILRMENTPPEIFNRVCNILTEFGIAVDYTIGMEEFFTEHMKVISAGSALQTLRKL